MAHHHNIIQQSLIKAARAISPSLEDRDVCNQVFLDPEYRKYHGIMQAELQDLLQASKVREDIDFPMYRPATTDAIQMVSAIGNICTSGSLCRYVETDDSTIKQAFKQHFHNCERLSAMNCP